MSLNRKFLRPAQTGAVALAAMLLWVACQAGNSSNNVFNTELRDPTPAGRVGDRAITVGELDAWVKDQLFARATHGGQEREVYGLRRRAFDQITAERLLEAEAAQRGLSSEALLEQEASARAEVDEAEIAELYEQNQERFGDRPRDEVEEAIRDQLRARDEQQAQQAYLKELRDAAGVTFLLEAPRVSITGTGHSRGEGSAPITVVEFSDYQCPYCKRAEPMIDALLERYPEQVRFEYRHFPLESIHPRARPASEAALCAGEQDRFWEYHRLVFEKAPALSDENLREYASQLELDAVVFDRCLAEGRSRQAVDADLEAGRGVGVSGTPSFFVNGIPVTGPRNIESFAELIDEELAKVEGGS